MKETFSKIPDLLKLFFGLLALLLILSAMFSMAEVLIAGTIQAVAAQPKVFWLGMIDFLQLPTIMAAAILLSYKFLSSSFRKVLLGTLWTIVIVCLSIMLFEFVFLFLELFTPMNRRFYWIVREHWYIKDYILYLSIPAAALFHVSRNISGFNALIVKWCANIWFVAIVIASTGIWIRQDWLNTPLTTSAPDDLSKVFVKKQWQPDYEWLLSSLVKEDEPGRWTNRDLIKRIEIGHAQKNKYDEEIPDEIFRSYVLYPLVRNELPHSQKEVGKWREINHGVAKATTKFQSLRGIIRHANRFLFIDNFSPIRFGGTTLGAQAIFQKGKCDLKEFAIWIVSSARINGIPARLAWSPWISDGVGGAVWVEFWEAGRWNSLFLNHSEFSEQQNRPWVYKLPRIYSGNNENLTHRYYELAKIPIEPRENGINKISLSILNSGGVRDLQISPMDDLFWSLPPGRYIQQQTKIYGESYFTEIIIN